MLNFQTWLEQDEIRSPRNVARRWLGKMPVAGAQNEKAIWQFVDKMSDEELNRDLLNVISRHNVHDPRYEEPIEGNLLNTQTGKLGQAIGIIAWPEESHFGFYLEGEDAGNMEVKHPPVIFDQKDKELLAGIIWHELRHAEDWARGGINYKEKIPQFNMGKYARHILEARAYADQLRRLLQRVGNVQEVMEMLTSGSVFGLDEILHNTAWDFLNMLKDAKNESVASWMAPAITAASTLMPQQNMPVPHQPAAITRQAENPARDSAQILRKMIALFHFRNFVA